ncbi:putative Response regulator [Candidatus Terasakiella magnetica]|uniref:Putative Response regulator n=1 Tax=Candidatus Terasakiella magnetica TaxID=1867952 RepID=A0A1C3RE05_9PROT|nr:HD domain-containing phosphohydrolase [Candidatus Terasakiella magnetica]SCA55526.1 putative Response regulator [Candidatus Terasakiella magnetica]
MLSPTQIHQTFGHASLNKSQRPGLVRALVISKYPKFRSEIVSALQATFEVDYYASTSASMVGLKNNKAPGLIVMDYELLVHDSRDFITCKMEHEKLQDIPIVVTGKVRQEEFNETVRLLCPVAYLRRPFMKSQLHDEASRMVDSPLEFSWQHLPKCQKEALQSTASNYRMMARRVRRENPLSLAQTEESCTPLVNEVLEGNSGDLMENIKGHHNYPYVHSFKVATLLSLLGEAIGIRDHELLTVTVGGMMMDIGKLMAPEELLNRPDRLSREELHELKKHVFHSHGILDKSEISNEGIRVIAEQHHERLDGSGYPRGLKGKDLNELARLAAIIDVFCALTDQRPYKPAYSFESSLQVLEKMEGKLDPFLLALFKEIILKLYKPVVH